MGRVALVEHPALVVLQGVHGAVGVLHGGSRRGECRTRTILGGGRLGEGGAPVHEGRLACGALGGGLVALACDTLAHGGPLVPLFLGALAAGLGIAVAFLRHGDLALQRGDARALVGHDARQLRPRRFGGGARAMGLLALPLDEPHSLLAGRHLVAHRAHPRVELGELVLPGFHLPAGERELHAKPSLGQFGVSLGAAALARERPRLALHLADQVVESRQIVAGFLEAPFGAAATVTVEADSRRFFEQLAPFIWTVGEQRVDHARLDHDAGIGAEPRAAHEVVDVAQAARRAIEEVLRLAGAREPARDHDFLERHGQGAVVVVEEERDFGHVHGTARRRALKDHLFHLCAAQQPCALLAEHPAHRVGDIGLAAPVGADDRRHAVVEDHLGQVGERLEAMHLQPGQSHVMRSI